MAAPKITSYAFSIILPVRNGGGYLKACVGSILGQTVGNYNLIIIDSGSTDGSIEWINTINDKRIEVYTADKPLTIEENWNRIKTIPRNEWMTIIGHDDILHPNYLEVITALINEHPDASLYQTHFDFIDAAGHFMRKCKAMPEVMTAEVVLKKVLANDINIYGTGFMMRSEQYDAVGGMPMFPNLMSADYKLWLELSSISYLAVSPVNCFAYRISQSTTATTKNDVYIAALKLLVDYILTSKNKLCPACENNRYIKQVLLFYCTRISIRLLKNTKSERNNLSVAKFLKECKQLYKQYGGQGALHPLSVFSVLMARIIDSTELSRKLYVSIKKIHPNPII